MREAAHSLLVLNVTTEGAASDMWLATAYHMAF